MADARENALVLTEGLALMIMAIWPGVLTLLLAMKRDFTWQGVGYFAFGCVLLALATVVRRDWQRLVFLVGYVFPFVYSGLLSCAGLSLLFRGHQGAPLIFTTGIAGAVAVLCLRFLARAETQPTE